MSAGDRAINYASMAFGGLLGFVVGLVIYRRTVARATELAATEGIEGEEDSDDMLPGEGLDEDDDGYAHAENSRLVRANMVDVDAAVLMDDDDISLWEADGLDNDTSYRDTWDEEAAVGKKSNGFTNGTRI